MVEEGTRVDRLVSIDVVERFEALQDEVDLMKNEIKQTLIDLREHMMKGRTVFSQPPVEIQYRTPKPLPSRVTPATGSPASSAIVPANGRRPSVPAVLTPLAHQADGMDPLMLGSIINWLGTVKDMGMCLQQVTPFLEAYEASGYLPSIMLKVLLRSLADLDQMTETPTQGEFSPEKYSECIGQLHEIICPVDISPYQASNSAESYPDYETESGAGKYPESSESMDLPVDSMEKEHIENLNGHKSDNSTDPAANGYNLTTIKVPEPEEESDDATYGGLNG